MSSQQYVSYSKGDVFSIKMVGSRDWVLKNILTLVDDFEAPREDDETEFDREFDLEFA